MELDITKCMYCNKDGFENYIKVLEHINKEHKHQDEHDGLLPIIGGSIYDDGQ
jgi:hypothetical protein|tara:strand:+ start:4836 stop:4994 length:159 start_codon:yes stop_codon:yes gene_type:complete